MSDFITSPTEVVKVGEPLSNSDAITKALEKGELYKRGFDDGYKRGKQERPTGKWTDDKCSVCGKGIEDLIDSREWYRNETPNYCPFCGVRIEEDKEAKND